MKARIVLFLCGDVMTGRGIDQALPHPGDPVLYESYIKDAGKYIESAEKANGPIPRKAAFAYIWGVAPGILAEVRPDARIINLETSITTAGDHWPGKSIHYRMHPKNAGCLSVVGIDCCSLANNHILDWGYAGLAETLETLRKEKIQFSGAGTNGKEAAEPALLQKGGRRIIIFSWGAGDSGIFQSWAASHERPGVNLLRGFDQGSLRDVKNRIDRLKRPGDIVVISIHWGANWGYEIPKLHRRFARGLIDGGADLIYGHSSHHVKGIEIYRDKLILYGCGDFITDYEGISGYEQFRDDLGLMYFPELDAENGRLLSLNMFPTRLENFRIHCASKDEALWLTKVLNTHSNVRCRYRGSMIAALL